MANILKQYTDQLINLQKQYDITIGKINKFGQTLKSNKLVGGSDINKFSQSVKGVNAEFNKLSKIEKERLSLINKLNAANSDRIQKNVELNLQLNQQKKINTQIAREKLGLVSLYEKESRKLNDLRKRYKDVALAEGQSSKSARRLEKDLNKLHRRLSRIDRAAGQFQRNIGNYTKGFRALTGILSAAGITVGLAGLFRVMRNGIGIMRNFQKEGAILAGVLDTTMANTKELTDDAIRLGSITAKTAQEITALQVAYARLGFTQEEILNLTEDTINGSIALNGELDETAKLTGAVVKTFNEFSTTDASEILDKMTKSTQESGLNFEKLQTIIPIVGGAANEAGIPFTKLLALLGKLADSGIDASMSATALRNIIIESSKQGLTYEETLTKIANSSDKLTASVDEFGKRSAISGAILSRNLKEADKFAESLDRAGGTAERVAKVQLDTLDGALTLLSSAWEGWVLALDKGDGIIGKAIRSLVEYGTGVLNASKNLDDFTGSAEKAGIAIDGLDGTLNALSGQIIAIQDINTAADVLNKRFGDNVSTAELFIIALKKVNEKFAEQGRLMTTEDIKALKDRIIELRGETVKLTTNNTGLNETFKESKGIIEALKEEITELSEAKIKSLSPERIRTLNAELEQTKILLKNISAGIEDNGVVELLPTKERIEQVDGKEIADEVIKKRDEILALVNERELELPFRAAVGEEEDTGFLASLLGLTLEEEDQINEQLNRITTNLKNTFGRLAQIRIDAAQEQENIRKSNIDDIESRIKEQEELNTDASNKEVNRLKNVAATEKKLQDEAIKEKEKFQKQQQLINDAEQISSIITAAANYIKIYSGIPFGIGQAIAATAIAAMIASFAAVKLQASQSVKAEKGLSYVLGGERHSNGGTPLPGNVEAEKGEVHSVFSRGVTGSVGANRLMDLSNAINAGAIGSNQIDMLLTGIGSGVVLNSSVANNGRMEDLLEKIVGNTSNGGWKHVSEHKKISDDGMNIVIEK